MDKLQPLFSSGASFLGPVLSPEEFARAEKVRVARVTKEYNRIMAANARAARIARHTLLSPVYAFALAVAAVSIPAGLVVSSTEAHAPEYTVRKADRLPMKHAGFGVYDFSGSTLFATHASPPAYAIPKSFPENAADTQSVRFSDIIPPYMK